MCLLFNSVSLLQFGFEAVKAGWISDIAIDNVRIDVGPCRKKYILSCFLHIFCEYSVIYASFDHRSINNLLFAVFSRTI